MKIFHGSIRKKLYILVLLAVLPVFLVLLVTGLANREESIRRAEKDVFLHLDSYSELQNRITDSTRTLLRTVTSLPGIVDLDAEESRTLLAALLEANPMYSNAVLVDRAGDVIAAGWKHDQVKDLNFRERKEFKDAIDVNGFASGEYSEGKQSSMAIFPFAMAVQDSHGMPAAVLIIGLDLKYYTELFEDRDYFKNRIFGLSDRKGVRLFRFPYSHKAPIGKPIKEEVLQAALRDGKGSLVTETVDGSKSLITFISLDDGGGRSPYMYMFLGQNYSLLKQWGRSVLIRLVVTSLFSFVLALVVAGLIGQKVIGRQIESLSRASMSFSRGEKDISTGIDYSDGEIGRLARTFDRMVQNIHIREEEKNRFIQQLNKSQKMDAIGQLAGGIAHDFNNLLSGILGAAELLGNQIPPDDETAGKFQQLIVSSATRGANLAGKLLAFSRTSSKISTLVDMHGIIEETVMILESTIDRRIEIHTDLRAAACHVKGDPSLFQSALLNLGINASQAISSAGRITIGTEDVELDEDQCRESAFDLKKGSHLLIELSDSGCGIPEENLDKIFEPFFTTKEQGSGTGLGLSAVYGTIKNYGGAITVSSKEKSGTVFSILLPNAGLPVADEAAPSRTAVKGKGTILIVDDEETVRTLATIALEEFGYDTFSVSNGREGVDFVKSHPGIIDLVLLDMIMPVMNGKECFFELQNLEPDLPVLLCSGLIRDEDLKELTDSGLRGFLHKPYQIHELSKSIADLLA